MDNLTFLQQLIARLKAKSPKFFKIITTLAAIVAFITGIPFLLQTFGVTLPAAIAPFASKLIAIAAIVGGIIAKLTVDTPVATNSVLKQIDSGVSSATAKNTVS